MHHFLIIDVFGISSIIHVISVILIPHFLMPQSAWCHVLSLPSKGLIISIEEFQIIVFKCQLFIFIKIFICQEVKALMRYEGHVVHCPKIIHFVISVVKIVVVVIFSRVFICGV